MTAKSESFKQIKCSNIEEFNNVAPALKRCSRSCSNDQNIPKNTTCSGDLSYGSQDISSFLDYYLIYDKIRVNQNSEPALSSFGCIYN